MPLTPEQRNAALARGRATAAANREARKAGKLPPITKKPVIAPVPTPMKEDEGALFDVEQAPEGILDSSSALDKVFKKLGLKGTDEKKEEAYKAPQAKLTKAQQSLYDSFAPLAIQAFIVCAGWSWSLLDKDFGEVLAPSEEVAEKIIAPLMRIYARTSKIGTSLNPNGVDAAASLAALIGYVWSSYSAYKLMKQEKAANEQGFANNYTELRARPLDASESGYGGENNGRHAHRAATGVRGAATQSDGPGQGSVDLSNLSDSERRAYEKLSVLRERDFASRARRSGLGG